MEVYQGQTQIYPKLRVIIKEGCKKTRDQKADELKNFVDLH